jgi:hypothetical protein
MLTFEITVYENKYFKCKILLFIIIMNQKYQYFVKMSFQYFKNNKILF